MTKRTRKIILIAAKLLVAGALLWLVVRQVHWNDYVITAADKKEIPIVAAEPEQGWTQKVQTQSGGEWTAAGQYRPYVVQLADGATASVLDAAPDWAHPQKYRVQVGRKPAQGSAGGQDWVNADQVVAGNVVHRGFRATVLAAQPWLLALSFVCFFGPLGVLSIRWWYLLRIQDIHIPLWEAVRLTVLGTFFSNVVPGTVSGDLIKAYYVSRHTERKAAALVAIFVDRAVGLLEFALLPAVVMTAMWLSGAYMGHLTLPAVMVAAVMVLVFGTMGLMLSPRLRQLLHLRAIISRLPLQQHIAVASEAAHTYRRKIGSLAKALVMTFGGQGIFIVGIVLAGQSLHLDVDWYQYFLYVPLIYIVAALPISPGGLGVAEYMYVTFFVPLAVPEEKILALALVARLFPVIVSLPGLVVAMTGAKLPKTAQMQQELDAASGEGVGPP